MGNVKEIRRGFKALYGSGIISDNGTVEMIGVSFIADEPAIFGEVNKDYVKREIAWYESQSLNVNDIEPPIPAIWKAVSDSNGYINSNYGWCIFSEENYNQYRNVLDTLKHDKYSRQANMIYTRPTMHIDATINGRKDFMCTNNVQALIRNDELHLVVNMRSNDVVYGYKNDYAWQKYVQTKLVNDLRNIYPELTLGDIHWQVGSLHVYPQHFHLIGE